MGWGLVYFQNLHLFSLQMTYNLHNTLARKGKLSIQTTCAGPIFNVYQIFVHCDILHRQMLNSIFYIVVYLVMPKHVQ